MQVPLGLAGRQWKRKEAMATDTTGPRSKDSGIQALQGDRTNGEDLSLQS